MGYQQGFRLIIVFQYILSSNFGCCLPNSVAFSKWLESSSIRPFYISDYHLIYRWNLSYMNLQKLFERNVNVLVIQYQYVPPYGIQSFNMTYSLYQRMIKAWEIERSKMRTYPELYPLYKFLFEFIIIILE